jgi:rod shape-determining protein MreC
MSANRANPAHQKVSWLLATLLLGQVVLMSAYARDPDSEQSVLRTWVMAAFVPIAGAANSIVSSITGTVGSYADLRGAREENIALKEQIEELTRQLNESSENGAENVRLRAELGLPARSQYKSVAANVVSRNVTQWFRRFTIDRGTLDGVAKNMPVATTTGIIGRVIGVGPNYAQVQVITDINAGVGVMLQSSRTPGELKGLGSSPRCELRNIPASENVPIGELVVTTGLDRIYPKGLMVGVVERVEENPNAPWHTLVIRPSAPVDRAEHVLVLLVEQKDVEKELKPEETQSRSR